MGVNETPIMKKIQIALARMGARCWRNNVGCLEDHTGNFVQFGLCTGSSDLIGYIPLSGKAVFLAVEVKAPGAKTNPKRLQEQRDFIAAVNNAGGIGFFAESVKEAERKLKEAIKNAQR